MLPVEKLAAALFSAKIKGEWEPDFTETALDPSGINYITRLNREPLTPEQLAQVQQLFAEKCASFLAKSSQK